MSEVAIQEWSNGRVVREKLSTDPLGDCGLLTNK
jgi:hypothetical protein